MSSIPSKKQIAKAMQDKLVKFNFNKTVNASHDFGYMLPIENKLVIPGDKFDINVNQFTRLLPLPAPTNGTIKGVTRAFFVPMHQLFKDWENFISNKKTPSVLDTDTVLSVEVPYMTVFQLSHIFLHSSLFVENIEPDVVLPADLPNTTCDIVALNCRTALISPSDVDESNINYLCYNLTSLGRKMMSLINGLGYNFPFFSMNNWDLSNPNSVPMSINISAIPEEARSYFANANTKISVLPLVAFWKAYIDWCIPSRYIRDGFLRLYTALDLFYKRDSSCYGGVNRRSVWHVSNRMVSRLLNQSPLSFFQDDYFSQAFKNPFGYEDSLTNEISIPNPNNGDFDDYRSVVTNGPSGAKIDDDNNDYINMFTLQSLGALQDLVNRGKLAGNKIQDYLRVTYGITPSQEAMNVSKYLGAHSFDIAIGDVMSNADTKQGNDGMYLGEYAGRGLGGIKDCKFSLDSNEHGFFFITTELYVKPSYVQGLRPEVTALDRFDFFQPEFDNMGVDAVNMNELSFTPLNYKSIDKNDITQSNVYDKIFGFVPRYAKLKTNFDSVLGDYRLGRVNTGLDSWYLSRLYNEENKLQWQEGINYLFALQSGSDGLQNYDRIFTVANDSLDHFRSIFSLEFTAYRHMKSLSEPFEVEENHGSEVSVQTQGAE